jgi:gluconolactonase
MLRWLLGAALLVGCGSDAADGADGPPVFAGSASGAGPSTAAPATAAPSNGVGGAGAVPGSTSPAGTSPGAASPTGSDGAPVGSATPPAGEDNGNVGPLDPGNVDPAGSAGGAGGNGPPASGGSGPGDEPDPATPGGPFVSVAVNGGASAAFVCPAGTFPNPLAGMGAVQSVRAPATSFFAFIEGPVWVGSRNRLFFSDNASSPLRIWQIEAPFVTASIFMPDSGSNGLAVDNEDQLLLADQSARRITRVDSGSAQVLETVLPAGNHTPNDLVLRSDENLYFSDPNSGGRGLYRVAPSGELSGPFTQANAANAPNAPNGVVLSPDENTLYVGDVQQGFVASFALQVDGAIDTASGQVFVRTQGDTVDGMAVDCAGNLYVGTRTGVEVYAPDATFIGTLPTGESSNATFGGADRRTLFVTSRAELKFVTLGVPGLPD